jgi:hypothetical protein
MNLDIVPHARCAASTPSLEADCDGNGYEWIVSRREVWYCNQPEKSRKHEGDLARFYIFQ